MGLGLLVFGVLVLPAVMAAGGLVWGGSSLLIDVWHCHRPRAELLERLAPLQPCSSLAAEAHRWLESQS